MSSALSVRGLGKKYKLYRRPWHRFLELASGGRLGRHREHWALRNVSLEVPQGSSLGIVGQNGAGKSTLLKIVVGTTQATEGEVQVGGRIAALLELGMGFHPEFSGRQNAVMAMQMTGLAVEEARALLPEVASFSELGPFLEQPLRTYSSGMQMRLGFAVATVRRPELLIVDEALSVGDAYFQHRCIRRIRSFRDEGTTMLFVSHDPSAVKTLCDRAVLLEEGRLVQEGEPEEILDYYNARIAQREKEASIEQARSASGRTQTRSGDGAVRIAAVELTDHEGVPSASFSTGETARVRCRVELLQSLDELAVGMMIRDRLGNDVFGVNTSTLGIDFEPGAAGDALEVEFTVDLELGYGTYSLTVAAHDPRGHLTRNHDWIDNAASFQVIPGDAERFAGVARLPVRAKIRTA